MNYTAIVCVRGNYATSWTVNIHVRSINGNEVIDLK